MLVHGGLENNSRHTNGNAMHAGIVRADSTSFPVHGIRTIFFEMLPDKDEAVSIIFIVCDAQEPITAFSQML